VHHSHTSLLDKSFPNAAGPLPALAAHPV